MEVEAEIWRQYLMGQCFYNSPVVIVKHLILIYRPCYSQFNRLSQIPSRDTMPSLILYRREWRQCEENFQCSNFNLNMRCSIMLTEYYLIVPFINGIFKIELLKEVFL